MTADPDGAGPAPAHALITGASSGIGESFARMLAARRHDLVLVSRAEPRLAEIAGVLERDHGVHVECIGADLADPAGVSGLLAELERRSLGIDLLVNNAGFAAQGEFWNLPLEEQRRMVVLHADAAVCLTHALAAPMIAAGRGGLINVSSITSFQPIPYAAVYAATKAFLTSFSLALAEELRPHGVRVVTLCPGGTRTNLRVVGRRGPGRFPGTPQEPGEVVSAALACLDRGGGLVVPRLRNKLMAGAGRVLPGGLLRRLISRLARPPSGTEQS